MARLAAVVAAAAGGATAEPQGRAVGLNMAKALAVVALLGLGRPGKRASVRLMAGLLAWGRNVSIETRIRLRVINVQL